MTCPNKKEVGNPVIASFLLSAEDEKLSRARLQVQERLKAYLPVISKQIASQAKKAIKRINEEMPTLILVYNELAEAAQMNASIALGQEHSLFNNDISCRYNARSPYLKCAVAPKNNCRECPFYESKELRVEARQSD